MRSETRYAVRPPRGTDPSVAGFFARTTRATEVQNNEVKQSLETRVGTWESYTPVWKGRTANPIGDYEVTGKYRRLGDSAQILIYLDLNTCTPATGFWEFSLPKALKVDQTKTLQQFVLGTCICRDNSSAANWVTGMPQVIEDTDLNPRGGILLNATGGKVGDTNPFTWANNDSLAIGLTVPIKGWT